MLALVNQRPQLLNIYQDSGFRILHNVEINQDSEAVSYTHLTLPTNREV